MFRRIVSGIMFALLLIGMLTLAFNIQPAKTEPTTIIVPDDYSTIQEAIDHANEGDTGAYMCMMVGCSDTNGNGLGDVLCYRRVGSWVNPAWGRETAWDILDVPGDRQRASPCFADLDDDGDYDLLISNAHYVPPMGYRNVGNRSCPIWERYSAWDVPNLNGYEQNPDLADLDNDGDYDLCIGTESFGHKACFFENNGTVGSPSWERRTDWDFVPSIDWPCPTFADLDGDGDYDLMLGSYTESYCVAWENVGDSTNPLWSIKPSWHLTALPANSHKKPTMVDMDNDGDYDLMVGIGNPYDPTTSKIWAYENTGNSANPIWNRKTDWDILLPGMLWIRPAFADLEACITMKGPYYTWYGLEYWIVEIGKHPIRLVSNY